MGNDMRWYNMSLYSMHKLYLLQHYAHLKILLMFKDCTQIHINVLLTLCKKYSITHGLYCNLKKYFALLC